MDTLPCGSIALARTRRQLDQQEYELALLRGGPVLFCRLIDAMEPPFRLFVQFGIRAALGRLLRKDLCVRAELLHLRGPFEMHVELSTNIVSQIFRLPAPLDLFARR